MAPLPIVLGILLETVSDLDTILNNVNLIKFLS